MTLTRGTLPGPRTGGTPPGLAAFRPVAGLVAAVGTWWGCVAGFGIRPFFLPSPPAVATALAEHLPYLLHQAAITLGHLAGGFTIATTLALATAILLSAISWLRDTVLPLLVALQAVPKVAFAPLLIVWLGFGPASKMTLVGLLCFFPALINTLAGLSATPTHLTDLARSLSASRWQTYTKIRIPHALPQVFTGLKVAISLALIGAVIAQITTPNTGLGAVIVRASQAANTPLAFAAIVLLAAIGTTAFYTLAAVERLALPWARASTA